MESARCHSVNGTVLSGRYRLESKLGSGGMSTVYLAQDEVLDRPVAVKLLHREISEEADQLERFRREARAAARLSPPEPGRRDRRRRGRGPALHRLRVRRGRDPEAADPGAEGGLEVDEAVAYAIEIGRGLIAAHGRKLIHRDVKPQNVLIDPDGRAKVTDFGIARSLESEGLTATGRVLGTTDYVSPEQAMGEDVDERSDVYSLGVVLYEMLTGEVPFQAETQVGVAMKHVNEPMPDVWSSAPDVSAAVAGGGRPRDRPRTRATATTRSARWSATSRRPWRSRRRAAAAPHGEATTVLDSVPRSRAGWAAAACPGAGVAMGVIGIALIAAALLFGGDRARQARAATTGERRRRRRSSPRTPPRSSTRSPGDGEETEHGEPGGRRQPDRDGLGRPSTTTPRTSAGSRTASASIVEPRASRVPLSAIEIRAADRGLGRRDLRRDRASRPTSSSGWGSPVGSVSDGGDARDGRPRRRARRTSYLIWITKPPERDERRGRFQMQIADVRLLG